MSRLLRITPTRLAAFSDCPRRFHLHYVEKASRADGERAHLSLGNTVHLALARWWDLPPERRAAVELRRRCGATEPDATMQEIASDLVTGAWQGGGFRDGAQEAIWAVYVADWVARYLLTTMPIDQPRGVERTVAVVRGEVAYDGRADRIDEDPDGLVIVDYKVGRKAPTLDDVRGSLALAIYAYAAWRVFKRRCVRVALHHVPTGTVVEHEHSDETLARQVTRADSLAGDVRLALDTVEGGGPVDVLFPPEVGPLCRGCEFREHCPEGSAAFPEETPWAVLERWDTEAVDTGVYPE